jgi:hypothetical protein
MYRDARYPARNPEAAAAAIEMPTLLFKSILMLAVILSQSAREQAEVYQELWKRRSGNL